VSARGESSSKTMSSARYRNPRVVLGSAREALYDAFVLTAYLMTKPAGGRKLWPKDD
jgi:hypothetical protein